MRLTLVLRRRVAASKDVPVWRDRVTLLERPSRRAFGAPQDEAVRGSGIGRGSPAPRLHRFRVGLAFLRSSSIGAAAARKSAHGSATEARRAGALRVVKWAGPISGVSSSQASGI